MRLIKISKIKMSITQHLKRIFPEKRFPGAYPVKLFTVVIHEFTKAFVPGKPFQPSLMFAGKARAYPRVEHLKSSRGAAVKLFTFVNNIVV